MTPDELKAKADIAKQLAAEMTTKLQKLVKQQAELTKDLAVSIELNRLFGSTDKALKLGAYQIKRGAFTSKVIFLTIRDDQTVKVFQMATKEFDKSIFAKTKVQSRASHPYPEYKHAERLTYEQG